MKKVILFHLKKQQRADCGFLFIQPSPLRCLGSPAEFSQLQVDDEILAINNTKFSYKDTKKWEEAMANAQETGNLVMDVRRYGKSGEFLPTVSGFLNRETQLGQMVLTVGFINPLPIPGLHSIVLSIILSLLLGQIMNGASEYSF